MNVFVKNPIILLKIHLIWKNSIKQITVWVDRKLILSEWSKNRRFIHISIATKEKKQDKESHVMNCGLRTFAFTLICSNVIIKTSTWLQQLRKNKNNQISTIVVVKVDSWTTSTRLQQQPIKYNCCCKGRHNYFFGANH